MVSKSQEPFCIFFTFNNSVTNTAPRRWKTGRTGPFARRAERAGRFPGLAHPKGPARAQSTATAAPARSIRLPESRRHRLFCPLPILKDGPPSAIMEQGRAAHFLSAASVLPPSPRLRLRKAPWAGHSARAPSKGKHFMTFPRHSVTSRVASPGLIC